MAQTKTECNKIYSLRKPHTQFISKGKKHEKYGFGSYVSITTKTTGVIIGGINIEKNVYDKTLQPAIEQQLRLT